MSYLNHLDDDFPASITIKDRQNMVKKTEDIEDSKAPKKTTNLMAKLLKLNGAATNKNNPFLSGVGTPSPSLNFTFGKTHILPFGYSLVLFGAYKSGKSLISHLMVGQLHKDDPTAVAIKFDTEYRADGQLTNEDMVKFGIDSERLVVFNTNQPSQIFDRIEHDVAALIQEGLNVKLIIIDSIQGIQGRRTANADSIDQQQIGDLALTLGEGFKRILPTIRDNKIGLVLITQVRAEMDPQKIRQHKTIKAAASYAVQHFGEYFMFVESDKTKAGKTDLLGNEFVNEHLLDVNDRKEKTALKVRVTMVENTFGVAERQGEFTFSYDDGIINTHEEIYLLAVNRGVIERPTNSSYVFENRKWVGERACVEAIKEDTELQNLLLKKIKELDV